jgi:ABC-2 type transport system permease protein
MKQILWFFRQAAVTYKSLFGIMSFKTFLLTRFIAPVSSMLFFCYLAMHAYGAENMAPWVIGNAFTTCVYPVFLGAGLVLMIERGIGTLRAIIATPTSRIVIFVSRSLMHVVNAVMVCIIALTIGILIFDIDFSHVNLGLFALSVITSMFGAIALGMVVSSLGLIVREIHMIMNVGILGLVILSGANVPLDRFPAPMLVMSQMIPVTRGIEAGRLLHSGGSEAEVLSLIGQEFLLGIIYLTIGFIMYRVTEFYARKHATLDIY